MIGIIKTEFLESARAAALGAAVFSIVEIALTLWAAPSLPGPVSLLRFVLLTFALGAVLGVVLSVVYVSAALSFRALARIVRVGGKPGLFSASPPPDGIGRGPWAWAAFVFTWIFAASSTLLIATMIPRFKELILTAALIATAQLVLVAVALAAAFGARRAARAGAMRLAPRLGRASPFGRGLPATLLLLVLTAIPIYVLVVRFPHYRPFVPWRLAVSLLAACLGIYLAKRRIWPRKLESNKRSALLAAAVYLVLVPASLVYWGADPSAKALAVTSSPSLSALVDGVRKANDVDRDGYGSLLGETDCAPMNRSIHPLAPEIPDNGIDENCDGRDLEIGKFDYKVGETPPVPPSFVRDWNVLLITVDTLRYDHTSFGGYIERSGRDTTPKLAELVARSVSFANCSAPSAGTMASIPAILTSKFFHSGIALGPNRKGKPPITKPENLLFAEIMKTAGYQTGAILTHHYFNDWGLDQGFDSYDNAIGKKSKPRDVSSDRVTDRALSWIAGRGKKKWFLWTHYLDPHGRYVAHPGEKSFGDTEKDLYDGELHYTDKQLGRLFTELARMPGVAENTIIIITSDHGDGFNEHGFINHGQALYRELLWVPLIFYVPSIQPRVVPGPVSPIDILPTTLDLVGIDQSRFRFEGSSLAAQLFYDKTAEDRVVFAETDWPKPQRAAISSRYKLIRKLQNNLFELYDLKADPGEKKNIARTDKAGFAEMNRHLDEWLERVYYARDQISNQQMMQLGDTLLSKAPTPKHPVGTQVLDGKLEVIGFDLAPVKPKKPKKGKPQTPSKKTTVSIDFKTEQRLGADYKIAIEVSRTTPATKKKSSATLTAKGRFPTSRWRPGEWVRHEAVLPVEYQALSGRWSFTLVMTEQPRNGSATSAPVRIDLGTIEPVASSEPPTPKQPVPKQPVPKQPAPKQPVPKQPAPKQPN